MAQYLLNEKQKVLLASIIPGIKDGTISLEWGVQFLEETYIFDDDPMHDVNFITLGWGKATRADFSKFAKCGFLEERQGSQTWAIGIIWDDVVLINAYESSWEKPDAQQPSAVHNYIQGNTITGIINISSMIENSTQYIQNSEALSDAEKAKLNALLEQLNDALQQVPPEHQKEAKAVATQAKRLAEDVTDPDADEVQKQISFEGLKKAAENLAKVTPYVLPIALEIIRFASQI